MKSWVGFKNLKRDAFAQWSHSNKDTFAQGVTFAYRVTFCINIVLHGLKTYFYSIFL